MNMNTNNGLVYEIKGEHEYELGINLFDLCKILHLKKLRKPQGWDRSPITRIEPHPEEEKLEVDFETKRSKVHYVFHKYKFEYHMQDADGGPIDSPEKAKGWTLRAALDWIQDAARREERPITEETLAKDVEWFLTQYIRTIGRPPTPEEIKEAYAMCPIQRYERGITREQAEKVYRMLGGE